MALKIAVNTRLLLKNRLEGIGWFTKETLSRIVRSHPEHEFLFIFDRKFDSSYIFASNVKGIVISPQARHPILFRVYFNWSIPRILKKEKADLFLSPDGFLSLRTKVPQLAVIHDLNFEHHPEALPTFVSRYYRHYFPKFAQIAKRIATVSKYSKLDISEIYNIDPAKIDVVYNGANQVYQPLKEKEVEEVRNKYSKGFPYFIYVGSLHARKNIVNLLEAYEGFRRQGKQEIPLILIGEVMWDNKDIEDQLSNMKFREDVFFKGRMDSDELSKVLGAALALTFVPLFEGFGIPALEAMKSGVPVIASNSTSIPEVVGDAGLLCDPMNTDQISAAMLKISNDEELRQKMIEKGLLQADKFSWEQSADKLWKCIEKVIHA